tara:strand:- start:125 stop:421 length:297 start_codon:yes stop_codon:yes gene_type:complete
MEAIILTTTILIMLAAFAVKYFAAKSIAHMKFQIGQQQQITGEAKRGLKSIENKKKLLENNRDILSKKRSKLSKKLATLTAELDELEQEEAERQQEEE